ncbi:hypothetical protein T265_16252, partial [Opisthorchis viverrini]
MHPDLSNSIRVPLVNISRRGIQHTWRSPPHVVDPCNGVQCHQYGVCEHGRCRCIKGYEGDGVFECRYR